jgi:PAS domain S-box-containing protein
MTSVSDDRLVGAAEHGWISDIEMMLSATARGRRVRERGRLAAAARGPSAAATPPRPNGILSAGSPPNEMSHEEVGREMTGESRGHVSVAASPVPHLSLAFDRSVTEVNEALCRLLGYRREEIVGRTVLRVVHPEDMEALILALDALVRAHHDTTARRFRFLHSEGSVVWLDVTMSLIHGSEEPEAVCLALSDVTDLHRVEELQRVVLETMDEGVCAVDAHCRITMVNSAATRLLGWSEDELLGRRAYEVVHGQPQDEATQAHPGCALARVLRGHATVRVTGESFTRRDGTDVLVAYSASPLQREGAEPGALIVFHQREREGGEPAATSGRPQDAVVRGA